MWRSWLKGAGIGCGVLLVIPTVVVLSIIAVPMGPFTASYKVEWEQGVKLPDSTRILHRENTGVPWMDSHASATIVMATRDLPGFLKQLKPPRPNYWLPGTPWRERKKDGTLIYRCYSNSSDGQMLVTVKPPRHDLVTVELGTYTD